MPACTAAATAADAAAAAAIPEGSIVCCCCMFCHGRELLLASGCSTACCMLRLSRARAADRRAAKQRAWRSWRSRGTNPPNGIFFNWCGAVVKADVLAAV